MMMGTLLLACDDGGLFFGWWSSVVSGGKRGEEEGGEEGLPFCGGKQTVALLRANHPCDVRMDGLTSKMRRFSVAA